MPDAHSGPRLGAEPARSDAGDGPQASKSSSTTPVAAEATLPRKLILGVPDRTVMDLMGWSTPTVQQRYMHVTEEVRRDVADQLNRYFWEGS